MYGWRAKIGLVVPANNTVIEPELNKISPPGVSIHAMRLWTQSRDMAEQLSEMERLVRSRLIELVVAGVDVVVYACMATGLIKGPKWAEEFVTWVGDTFGIRATTASRATVAALHHLKVKRIALVTPYPSELNEFVVPFFEQCGFDISEMVNMPVSDLREVCRIPPEMVYRLARDIKTDPQAICILATDLRSIESIEALEHDLGKPVVSTNQAILWQALKTAGVNEDLRGYGDLLRNK